MDPIFVNRCAFNKSNLLEMTKYTRRSMRLIVYVSAGVLILSSLASFFLAHDVTQGLLWMASAVLPRIHAPAAAPLRKDDAQAL
jgi:hypothetical protein